MMDEGKEQFEDDEVKGTHEQSAESTRNNNEANDDQYSQAEREEIYSNVVRAGKRTYFFDVKSTKNEDYYLTITESKKRFNKNGKYFFEKHKIFLYKEDFEKFADALTDCVDYIKKEKPELMAEVEARKNASEADNFTDVNFDDLDT